MINLPFEVTEKSDRRRFLRIRDLLYAAKLNKHFLALIISQNGQHPVRFGNLFVPVRYGKMPKGVRDVMNQHSLPVGTTSTPKRMMRRTSTITCASSIR